MAAQFYARYVPPAQSQSTSIEDQADARPKKRKKVGHASREPSESRSTKSKTASEHAVLPTEAALRPRIQAIDLGDNHASSCQNVLKHTPSLVTDGETQEAIRPSLRKRKKKDKKSKAGLEKHVPDTSQPLQSHSQILEDGAPTDSKTRRIREKFARSKAVGDKLAEKLEEQKDRDDLLEEDDLEKVKVEGLKPLPQPAQLPDSPMRSTISALPEWLAKPIFVRPDATASFADLKIDEGTKQNLLAQGFESAFAIQAAVLQLLLPGTNHHQGDLCVSAATGSGKSLAYTLPMIQALKNKPVRRLRGVVVVPTRELVDQAKEIFKKCNETIEVGTAVGSVSLRAESGALVDRLWKYDPKAYQIEQKKSSEVGSWDWLDQSDDGGDDDFDERAPNLIRVYESKVDVLVCTPGRLVDHIKTTKGFTLEHVQWLVIDEADRLLDQDFQQWLEVIMPALEKEPIVPAELWAVLKNYRPLGQKRVRKIILSATIARDVSKLEPLNLYKPALVALEGESFANGDNEENRLKENQNESITALPPQLTELAIAVREVGDKPLYLLQLIEEMTPFKASDAASRRDSTMSMSSISTSDTSSSNSTSDDSSSMASDEDSSSVLESSSSSEDDETSSDESSAIVSYGAEESASKPKEETKHGMLVFTNTNENALRLSRLLIILRPSLTDKISPLTKSSGTASGRKTLAAFRKRNLSVIVASDRASRGLDLKNLAHVVNYDMPTSLTSYVHRIGRTARAGLSGTATTLVAHHEARWFWNEIGRSTTIERSKKVSRKELRLADISDEDREKYEAALSQLGREARGEERKATR